jgi:[ribosomal protein S18]-alanine N-acetyltransferase
MTQTAAEHIVISEADRSFGPVLAELFGQSFDEPWPLASIENLMAPAGCWGLIAECLKGEVLYPCGFALARAVGEEAELLSMGVIPAFRRRGVARAIMEALACQAVQRGAREVFLEVGVDNPSAEHLYRASGFVEVGRRKNYYRRANRDLVDALVMKVVL